jgi:hypothetical protein
VLVSAWATCGKASERPSSENRRAKDEGPQQSARVRRFEGLVALLPVVRQDGCFAHRIGVPMKKFALVLVVLGVAAAIGYLMGTEGGRARKDAAVSRLRKASDSEVEPEIDLRETGSAVAESGAEIVEKVANAVGVTFH